MSRFLVQTKTFLPMVIQKTATETVQILETQQISRSSKVVEKVEAGNVPVNCETQVDSVPSSVLLENLQTESLRENSILQAFILDLAKVQGWLAAGLARGQALLVRRERALFRSLNDPSTLVWHEGRPQLKERDNVPVGLGLASPKPEQAKKVPAADSREVPKADQASREVAAQAREPQPRPPQSKMLEALVARVPDWQKSISFQLGVLQKKVVQTLAK